MDSYSVRSASIADEQAVSTLLRASYPILMASAYDERALKPALELMTQAQPALLMSGTFYVAELIDENIVGCGGWTKERPGDGKIEHRVGHLRHFGTHPKWIGRGVARAIFSRCEREARDAGITELECYSSLNAEAFYTAMGFEPVAPLDLPLVDGVNLPSVHMRLRI